MPEISIIVPVYNVEKYLRRCLDSILAQTFKDFELILVDDGATDKSGEICDEYAKSDSRIRVIHKENGGLSDARNSGIEAATGKYLGFVDSDDYIAADMYEMLYNNLVDKNADVSVCGIYNCYNNRVITDCESGELFVTTGKEALMTVLECKKFTVQACNKLYKTKLFEDIRYPVGKLYEDAFVIPKILSKADAVVFSTTPKYYWFRRENSITTSDFKINDLDILVAYKHNLEFVRKDFPDLESYAVFRYLWSLICVLDKMILSKNFTHFDEKKRIIKEIRANTLKILANPCFSSKRKIATLILLFSESAYVKITISNNEKNMAINKSLEESGS